jgi:hypothetical protein
MSDKLDEFISKTIDYLGAFKKKLPTERTGRIAKLIMKLSKSQDHDIFVQQIEGSVIRFKERINEMIAYNEGSFPTADRIPVLKIRAIGLVICVDIVAANCRKWLLTVDRVAMRHISNSGISPEERNELNHFLADIREGVDMIANNIFELAVIHEIR